MKKKRLLCVVSLGAAIMAAMWLSVPGRGPISRTAYDRIQQGMSEDDVLAIMMVAPGNYITDFYTSVGEVESEGRSQRGRRLCWISNQAGIVVEFDEREEVCWKHLFIIEAQGGIQAKFKRAWSSIKSWF